jgi:glycosylphosphatidylinositol transamidase (GPIT) subunit GPI8
MSLSAVITVIAVLAIYIQCQKAIIFSSSIGYYNYRQSANALVIYHKLKEYGFSDEDVTLMIG